MGLSEEYLKSVSESELKDRAYTPFEIDKSERDSIEDIKNMLKTNKYQDVQSIQDSLDFIEKLSNKINIAVTTEKKESKTTWELEADLAEFKKIFDQLDALMQKMEQKQTYASSKERAAKPKLKMPNHKPK